MLANGETPDNRFVKRVKQQGLPCNILHRATPPDVCQYRKDKANDFATSGAQWTLFDMFEAVPQANASWAAHRKEKNYSCSSCAPKGPFSYTELRKKHILDNFKIFGGIWEVFKDATNTLDICEALELIVDLEHLCNERADFLDPNSKNLNVILSNMTEFLNMLMQKAYEAEQADRKEP